MPCPTTRIHPLTGAPIVPIGYIAGRPVWPIMGASEAPPETPPPADETETETETETGDGDKSKGGKLSDADAAAALKEVRAEAAKLRIKVRDADKATDARISAALKALGVDVGKDEDPVKVAQQAASEAQTARDTAQKENRSLRAELIVWRNAASLKVNAAMLTDSKSFDTAIGALDPAADDFEAKVKKAAQDAAKNNPALQAQAAAGKSGAEFNGGTGEGARKANSLEEAIAARMGV